MDGYASRLAGLPVGDSPVCEFQELRAAAAHLDGNVAQSGALELDTGRLSMIRATDRLQFLGGSLLEFLY
jgi:hypothetical protein